MRGFLIAAAVAALAVPTASSAVEPQPSWRCVKGICIGQSRASISYRFGNGVVTDIPSEKVRVPGGRVWVCYFLCRNAVSLDYFTYFGGDTKPSNRVLTIYTCDPIFRLPDGVEIGTTIPFSKRWNGYQRTMLYEPYRIGWTKTVKQGTGKVRVFLDMNMGVVQCVYMEQAK